MRKRKKCSPLTPLVLLLCLALLGGTAFLLIQALPQKKAPDTVSTLETNAVFDNNRENTVEPDREEAYEGDLPAQDTVPEPEPAQEEPVPDTEPVPEQPDPSEDAAEKLASDTLASMTLEEKLWQLFFVTPESLTGYPKVTEAGPATEEAIGLKPVGGLIYFAQNLEEHDQVVQMLTGVQGFSRIPLFLGVDEEGGTVSRVGSNEALGGTNVGRMQSYGEAGDPASLYNAMNTVAKMLTGLGFNLDFAPVADVSGGRTDNVIGSRSFGTDPELCASMVSVALSGLQDNGIVSCLKHFPGYGSAVTDDHYGTSTLSKTLEELESCDFLPFASGIESGAAFVMVSHLSVPEVTGDETPGDLSSKIVSELLRNKLGFQNVIITDAQNMGAITDHYTSAEAAVQALSAGVDMVLMPDDLQAAYDGVLAAVQNGTLTEARINESVLRILTVKAHFGILTEVPPAAEGGG